jgi:hypothetical protein
VIALCCRRLRADGVDADVCAHPVGRLLHEEDDVVEFVEVVDLGRAVVSYELEAVLDAIDHDHAARAEEPCATRGHDADRAAPKMQTVSPGWMPAISAA